MRAGVGNALDALFEAVELRTAGTAFTCEFALSDPRAALAIRLAPMLLQSFNDYDERLAAFDSLAAGNLKIGETAQANLGAYDPAVLKTLKDVAKLCEGAEVRTTLEYERLCRHLRYSPQPVYVAPAAQYEIPEATGAGEHVLVWAPDADEVQTLLIRFGLNELHAPVAVALGKPDPELFGKARVVVDASLDHPGNTIELVKRGYTAVSATSAAAHECVVGAIEYEPWNHRSVYAAVCNALGAAPQRYVPVHIPAQTRATVACEDGPLVSIIVRTYNRPQFLPRALESLEHQTYRNLEILVINDGGADVAHVVAPFSRARYLALPDNRGTSGAANAGLVEARGVYVGLLDDDDIVFPDHVGTLVAALQNSDAAVAHTDTIAAHYKPGVDGDYSVAGYVVFLDGLVEPTDFYVTDSVGPMAVLMKRSVALAAGGFEETLTHAEDWELFLKLSQHYDFVHVPRVTGMYSIRHDGSHMMSNAGEKVAGSMQRMLELHPLPHRPVMENARRASLEKYRKSGHTMRFPEPALKRP